MKRKGIPMKILASFCFSISFFTCVISGISSWAAEKTSAYHKILPSGEMKFIMPDGFYKVREDYVTPHISWAKPYSGGTIKALIIASRYAHRETVELSQRLSLDYDTIMTLGKPDEFAPERDTWVYGCSSEDIKAEFNTKLRDEHDVIIFGRFNWNALPEELEELLINRLENGMGLVLVVPPEGRSELLKNILSTPFDADGENYIASGVPIKNVPGFLNDKNSSDEPLVRCVQYKAGRIVLLNYYEYESDYQYFSITPRSPEDRVIPSLAYDYYHSLVCKAVLWAAGKAPKISIGGTDISDIPIKAEEFAEKSVKIRIYNNSEKRLHANLEIIARTWDSNEEQTFKQNIEIGQGTSEALIQLPRLAGGPHFIDIWLRQDGKVLDWFTAYIEIIPKAQIAEVKLSQPSCPIGGNVEGVAIVDGAEDTSARLEIQMIDSFERVMTNAELDIDKLPATLPFSLPFLQPVAIQHRIVATLIDESGAIDRKEKIFAPLDLKKYDDFAFVAWGGVGNNLYRQRMLAKRCYELGADSAYGYGKREPDWEKNSVAYWTTQPGLSLFLYATYLGGAVKDKIRSRCLSNPKEIAGLEKGISSLTEINRHMGGIGYSTGDEYPLARPGQDCCWSEWCLADLRRWLKDKYGTLEKLNEVWKSNFTSWEEVEPFTFPEGGSSGNFAPWADGREHMEFVFADIHRRLKEAVNKHHSGAPVGEEGMYDADTYNGPDWELFRDAATLLHGYERPTEHEHIRSLARKGDITGYWFGSYYVRDHAEEKMRWHPWFGLFNGYNSAWWWTVSGADTSTYPGGFNPDLTPCSTLDWTMQEVREIKSGTGKLLLNCKRENDSIAIHYSMDSHRAAYPHSIPSEHWTGATHHARIGIGSLKTAWNMILEDIGLQYEYVCTADIEKDALIKRGFRALIMPVSQSLTETEAEAILKFAQSGGTVIADLRPGVLNSVLNIVNPGHLDDLFGISRPDGLKSTITFDLDIPFTDKSYSLVDSHIDSGIKLTTGKAKGGNAENPVVIQNNHGAGKAILLNFGLGNYYDEWRGDGSLVTDLRNTSWGENIRGLIKALLAESEVQSRLQMLDKDSKPFVGVESVFFSSDKNEYLGLLYKPDIVYFLNGDPNWIAKNYDINPDTSPVPMLVKLDKEYHIYDVRGKRYIGFTDHIKTAIAPGQALLYSLLPYKVTEMIINGQNEITCGEQASFQVSLQTTDNAPEMHCFRVEGINPEGYSVREYSQNVIAHEGFAKFTIPFALNDVAGTWQVKVRDIASGTMVSTKINLENRQESSKFQRLPDYSMSR